MAYGDRGGAKKKKRRTPPPTTRAQKRITAEVQTSRLYPWEVAHATPPSPAPISDVGMESRRQQRFREPFSRRGGKTLPPPPKRPTEKTLRKQEDNLYKLALGASVDAEVWKGSGKDRKLVGHARDLLARSMTPEQRAAYHQSYEPPPERPKSFFKMTPKEQADFRRTYKEPPDGGFIHAVTHAGPLISSVVEMGKSVLPLLVPPAPITTPMGQTLVSDPYTPAERKKALKEGVVGKALFNLPGQVVGGGKPHYGAAALEFGALVFPPGKAAKMGHGFVEALGHTHLGPEAMLSAYEARAGTPLLGASAIRKALGDPLLNAPERARVHTAMDRLAGSKAVSKTFKDQVDATVHERVMAAPKEKRAAVARSAYQEILASMPKRPAVDEWKGIYHAPNQVLHAEMNPHRVPLKRPIPALNEKRVAAHIEKTIAEIGHIPSLKELKDPAYLDGLFHNAYRLAVKGAEYRQWYETSAKAIIAHVHGDLEEADKLAQLFAIYSANKEVPGNSLAALRAYDEFQATRKITEGTKIKGGQVEDAMGVMQGKPWNGRKTNSFYSNMAKHILSPERYKVEFPEDRVTSDIWMMRLFNFTGKVPTPAQYTWIENSIREMARQMKWAPEEVQAAAWVGLKSEWEHTTMDQAAFDFAHGIGANRGQVSYEALPEHLVGVLPPELRAQHLQDVLDVIAPNGENKIHEIVGIPGVGGHLAPEGTHNPGAAHFIPLVRTKGGSGYTVTRAHRQMAQESAAATGYALEVPEVAWGRVFDAKSRGHANAIRLTLPEGLAPELVNRIRIAAGKRVKVIHAPEGAWLVNKTGTENKVWLDQMEKHLMTVEPGLERKATAVVFDGGIVTKRSYGNTLGRLEKRRPGSKQALDRLAGDVRAVHRRYTAEATARAATQGGRQGPVTEFGLEGPLGRITPEEERWQRLHPGRTFPGSSLAEEGQARANVRVQEPRFTLGPKSKQYSLRPAEDGDYYFNWQGGTTEYYYDPGNQYEVLNLYDEADNHIGSITLDRTPGNHKVYVGQVWIEETRRTMRRGEQKIIRHGLGAFKELIRPVVEDGRPIEASFANAKLEKVFWRVVRRAQRDMQPREGLVPEITAAGRDPFGDVIPSTGVGATTSSYPTTQSLAAGYAQQAPHMTPEELHADAIDNAVYELQAAAHQSTPEFDQAVRWLRTPEGAADPAGISAFLESTLQHYEEAGPPRIDPAFVSHVEQAMRYLDSLAEPVPTLEESGQQTLGYLGNQTEPFNAPPVALSPSTERAISHLEAALRIDQSAPVEVDLPAVSLAIRFLRRGESPAGIATFLDDALEAHLATSAAGRSPSFDPHARAAITNAIDELIGVPPREPSPLSEGGFYPHPDTPVIAPGADVSGLLADIHGADLGSFAPSEDVRAGPEGVRQEGFQPTPESDTEWRVRTLLTGAARAGRDVPEFLAARDRLMRGNDPGEIADFIEGALARGGQNIPPTARERAILAVSDLRLLRQQRMGGMQQPGELPGRYAVVGRNVSLLNEALQTAPGIPEIRFAADRLQRGDSFGDIADFIEQTIRRYGERGVQVDPAAYSRAVEVMQDLRREQEGIDLRRAADELGVDLSGYEPPSEGEFARTGERPVPSPEEEAWQRQHPGRTPGGAPEQIPGEPRQPEPAPMGPVDPERGPNSLAEGFTQVAVKTSALNARFVELSNKLDKTQFEWEEMQRIKSELRQRRRPLQPPPFAPRAPELPRPIDEIIDAEFSPGRRHGMATQYGRQEVGRRATRAERLQRGREARAEAGGGLAGHIAARVEQRGELPRLKWNNGLRQEEVDRLTRYVEDNNLHGGDEYKLGRITDSFTAIVRGQIPTPSQLKLLDEIFGPEEVAAAEAEINFWMKARYRAADVLGLPRALKSSIDFSAPFRQGLFMLAAEPGMWAKSWPKGGAALWSKKNEERMMIEILTRPTAREYRRGGLAIIDEVSAYEEAYATSLAKHIPFVAGSQRGYVMFLNRLRADAFDHLYYQGIAEHPGWAQDETFVKSIAQTVNMLTGRGRFPFGWEPAVKAFSAALFSPRLIASRVEFLLRPVIDPLTLAPGLGDPRKALARKMVRRSLIRMTGGAALVLNLASFLPGVEIDWNDANSSDFLKIKKGDFRLDILGGSQQYLVFASRLISGEKTNSSTGEKKKLEGYGHTRFLDTTIDFLDNKAAPIPAFFLAWDAGRTPIGEPFDPISWLALEQTFAPLGASSGLGTARNKKYGPATGAIDFGLSSIGFGTQVYGPRPPSGPGGALIPVPKDPYGGDPYGGGGKDPYSGSANDPYGG